MPGPHDIAAAAFGELDHGMTGAGILHAQVEPFALGNRAEEHGGSGPVGVQFLPVAKDAFACPQNQADDVVLYAPRARRAVQAGGCGIEPVQVGDGEEAVGVGAVAFVRGVPVRPSPRRRIRCVRERGVSGCRHGSSCGWCGRL